jgi:hypothetical protein
MVNRLFDDRDHEASACLDDSAAEHHYFGIKRVAQGDTGNAKRPGGFSHHRNGDTVFFPERFADRPAFDRFLAPRELPEGCLPAVGYCLAYVTLDSPSPAQRFQASTVAAAAFRAFGLDYHMAYFARSAVAPEQKPVIADDASSNPGADKNTDDVPFATRRSEPLFSQHAEVHVVAEPRLHAEALFKAPLQPGPFKPHVRRPEDGAGSIDDPGYADADAFKARAADAGLSAQVFEHFFDKERYAQGCGRAGRRDLRAGDDPAGAADQPRGDLGTSDIDPGEYAFFHDLILARLPVLESDNSVNHNNCDFRGAW